MISETKNNSRLCVAMIALMVAVAFTMPSLVLGQAAEVEVEIEETVEPTPLTAEQAEDFDALRQRMELTRAKIEHLEGRHAGADEISGPIFELRLDKLWIQLVEEGVDFAEAVQAERDNNVDTGEYQAAAVAVLKAQGEVAGTAWKRVQGRGVLPGRDESAADQAAGYDRLFKLQKTTDHIFDDFIQTLELLERLDKVSPEVEAAFNSLIAERAMGVSIFLEMSIAEVDGLRAGVDVLPDDAELKAKLAVAQKRVRETAEALQRVVDQMSAVGLESPEYQEQLLTATGAITTDIFNLAVIANVLSKAGEGLVEYVVDDGPSFLFQLIIFVIIILAFRKLGQGIEVLVGRGLRSGNFELSQLLRRMIISTVGNLVMIFGVLIALSQLGISLGPLLAGLGIAGFVIGFALQDTLGNFASGLMILFYRPFDVGDVVEAGGVFGKGDKMSMVNCTIMTFDNQTIVLPNNMIWGGVIKNLTNQQHRRVDLTFGVSYTDDIPKVEKLLEEVIASNEQVLADPEPMIRLHELADSSVNFVVRPWVKSEDYWDVYWDLTRTIKMRFDEEGISIPFPQRDVHLYSATSPLPASSAPPSQAAPHKHSTESAPAIDVGDDD